MRHAPVSWWTLKCLTSSYNLANNSHLRACSRLKAFALCRLSRSALRSAGSGSLPAFPRIPMRDTPHWNRRKQITTAHHDVTVIARPDSLRLQQLQRDQGIIFKTGERAEVRVADKLDEQAAYNLAVVTTPAHQVDAVLPALQRSKAQWIQFMFLDL